MNKLFQSSLNSKTRLTTESLWTRYKSNVKRSIYTSTGDRAMFAIIFSIMINCITFLPVIGKDELNISPNKRTATANTDNRNVVRFESMSAFSLLDQFANSLNCIKNHDMANHLQRFSLGISAISQMPLAFADFVLKSISISQVILVQNSRVTEVCL